MVNCETKYCYGFEKKTGSIIHIEGLDISEQKDLVELAYRVTVGNGGDRVLWFRFLGLDKESISYEVSDGVAVMLLSFAMRGGYHIHSEIPMSSKLWFQLTEQLIPQICKADTEAYHTQIEAPLIQTDYHPKHVATAMSCGVDSFATFFRYTKDCPNDDFRVDTLTFFQNGAHHGGVIGHNPKEPQIFAEQCAHVKAFCEENGYRLLEVESNLDAFLSDVFWKDSFHYTHTFRNAGFVLLLQKYIRMYYYSGVHDITKFRVSTWTDPESYEEWMLPLLSTVCTCFHRSISNLNRVEKTAYISQYPEVFDHLLVCYCGGENCGVCVKCKRTLLTLDSLRLLDSYANSFDIQKYRESQEFLHAELCLKRIKDTNLQEVYRFYKEKGIHFSLKERVIELSMLSSAALRLPKRAFRKMRKRQKDKKIKT